MTKGSVQPEAAASREVLLSARGLTKSYRRGLLRRRQAVLRGADLELRPGQVVGMIGENGSGKSTLMRILVGALRADSGSVTHTGRIGYCPQAPLLYPRLTCDEHFDLFGHAYGMTRQATEQGRQTMYDVLGFGPAYARHPRRAALGWHAGETQPRAGPAAEPRAVAARRAVRQL